MVLKGWEYGEFYFETFINSFIANNCIHWFCYFFDDAPDTCLDIGYCKKGLQLNTEYGLVTINKETCKKYNWTWYDNKKECCVR